MNELEILNAAADLSNFEGLDEILGDDEVNFSGSEGYGFAPILDNNRVFTLTLVNANASVRYALLAPGTQLRDAAGAYLAGTIRTGAFNDRDGNAGLTGSSGGAGTIEQLNEYLRMKPHRCQGFMISTTDATQLSQQIVFQKINPFQTQGSVSVDLTQYRTERADNDKLLTVPYAFQFDDDTKITLPIVGSSTCTIVFYFGAGLDRAKKLSTLATRADQAIARTGKPKAIAAVKGVSNFRKLLGG